MEDTPSQNNGNLRDELLKENQILKDEINELKKKIYKNTETFRENSERIKLLKIMREKYQGSDFLDVIEKQKADVVKMKERYALNEVEIEHLQSTMHSLRDELNIKEQILSNLMSESVNLHKELHTYRNETKELRIRSEDTKQKYNAMREEKRELSEQLDMLRKAIANREKHVRSIRNEMTEVMNQKDKLLEEERNLQKEMQTHKEDIVKLNADIVNLKSSNKALEKERPVLLTRIDQQRALLRDQRKDKKSDSNVKRFFGLF